MFCRRSLLITLLIFLFFAVSAPLSAKPKGNFFPKGKSSISFPAGDGKICLYNYHEGQVIEARYRDGDRYHQRGLDEIKHIFRSRDGAEHVIDVELIELLDHLQEYFAADCVELISGYRSPSFNRKLKEGSDGIAEASLHVEGRAADVHLDEVTEKTLSRYVRSLGVGGVGYYPRFDFVHVDTGELRRWDRRDGSGRALIAIVRGERWQLVTDRNIYRPGDPIDVAVTNISDLPHSLDGEIIIERFRRGKWSHVGKLSIPKGLVLEPGKTWRAGWKPKEKTLLGKFRMLYPKSIVRSNEFYRKRL